VDFVLDDRCGAAPDFHRVPSSLSAETESTNTNRNVWGLSDAVNQYLAHLRRCSKAQVELAFDAVTAQSDTP